MLSGVYTSRPLLGITTSNYPAVTSLSQFAHAKALLAMSTLYNRYFAFCPLGLYRFSRSVTNHASSVQNYCNSSSCSHVGLSNPPQYVKYCTAVFPPSPLASLCFVNFRGVTRRVPSFAVTPSVARWNGGESFEYLLTRST